MHRTWPVSVKGVVRSGDRVLLALNNRNEWELPGGRLDAGETPEQCVAREIREETGLEVRVGQVVRSWVFEVVPRQHVLVLAYGCQLVSAAKPIASDEHVSVEFVRADELSDLPLPDGYRAAIADWPRQ